MSLRIRKLCPYETGKLMGFPKQDTQAMLDIPLSEMQVFHCHGDSIVVTCLMGIFGKMFFTDEELKEKIENYVEQVKES